MRKILAVVLALLLAVPFPALASNCRTTTYVAPVHYQQQFVVQDYHHAQQIIVPKAFQVQVNTPFYMGVSDDLRQLEFAKQVALEYSKIVEYQRQQLLLGGATNNLGPTPQAITQPTSKIGVILAKNCVSCHSPGKQEPDLSGKPEQISEMVRLKSFAATARGEMPKKGQPLSQDEFNEVGAWSKQRPDALVPPTTPIPPAKKDPEAKKEILVAPDDKK